MIKDQNNPEEEPELILQTTVTKRRFQEFLNLHSRLEENNNLKAALKGSFLCKNGDKAIID